MSEVDYSHPDDPVRHSYPLHEKNDGFSVALGLCMKTMPYILIRMALLAGFTLGALIWFGLSFAIAALMAEQGGMIAFFFAVGVPAGIYMWFRKYVLYMLKAGHIAVLTRLITHGTVEQGSNQISYGKKIVTDNFAEVNVMFVLDSLVDGVTRSFTRTLNAVTSLLPIPGLDSIVDVVEKIIQRATTYIDECIFSYGLARGDDNKWRSAKDGLIYYGQNWKPVLKTAIWSLVFEYALTALIFIVFTVPAGGISYMFPVIGGWAFVFAFLFALNVKAALIRPMLLTMVMLTFHKEAQGQSINPEVDSLLSGASDKFKELSEKAQNWVAARTGSGVSAEPKPLEQTTQP